MGRNFLGSHAIVRAGGAIASGRDAMPAMHDEVDLLPLGGSRVVGVLEVGAVRPGATVEIGIETRDRSADAWRSVGQVSVDLTEPDKVVCVEADTTGTRLGRYARMVRQRRGADSAVVGSRYIVGWVRERLEIAQGDIIGGGVLQQRS